MTNINKYEPPESSTGDTFHLAAKGILSLIPGASELFEYFIKPPLEKRREIWMNMVAEVLKELEKARFDIERLQSDERFITIILQATTIAFRNHQQEKLIALRNAIINSTKHTNIDEDIQLLFIRYIDEMTPSHMKLLTFFIEEATHLSALKSYPELYQTFVIKHPNLFTQDEFRMMLQDISSRGLIRISPDIDDFEDIYQANGILTESTRNDLPRIIITDMARGFLDFVTVDNNIIG